MSTISLQGSIRSCQVDSGWANRLQSDRFLNPSLMVCPNWNGVDTSGRPACVDSYWTKSAGCNSASDRVIVENGLRPQYIEYVNLDASGIRGGQQCNNNNINSDTLCHKNVMDSTHNQTGQFGLQTGFSQNVYANCVTCQGYPNTRTYEDTSSIVEKYKAFRNAQRMKA